MITSQLRPVLSQTVYDRNRERFGAAELAAYEGQWVAFSQDGSRIVAAAPDLLALDQRIAAAGENPECVGLEFIEFLDSSLGGMEAAG